MTKNQQRRLIAGLMTTAILATLDARSEPREPTFKSMAMLFGRAAGIGLACNLLVDRIGFNGES